MSRNQDPSTDASKSHKIPYTLSFWWAVIITIVSAALLVGHHFYRSSNEAKPAHSSISKTGKTVLDLDAVYLESIEINGRIQTWNMTKVCIDDQAYILLDGVSGPNGIAPAFKNGKPEKCGSAIDKLDQSEGRSKPPFVVEVPR